MMGGELDTCDLYPYKFVQEFFESDKTKWLKLNTYNNKQFVWNFSDDDTNIKAND